MSERRDQNNLWLEVAELISSLQRRVTAIEAELAVMRGTQSASRWSGDSPPMTIGPTDE